MSSVSHFANDIPKSAFPADLTQGRKSLNWNGIAPGIVLVAMITAVAFSARNVSGSALFSPMILAVVAGMIYSNVLGTPVHAKAGIAFSQKRLLRFAIVLLGFQLTLGQVISIGAGGVGIVAATLGATFVFTTTLGRLIGVDAKLAQLIAAGTSICGASAIVATNIVTDARDEDVTYAVASITLFGTVAMLGFPLMAPMLGLDQHAFGLWAGASIHEVAQVIGAGFQNGTQSGEIATVAKLTRVAMLAPMVVALGLMARRRSSSEVAARPPMPWFVASFVAIVALNSLVTVPAEVKSAVALATTIMLTMGLAAMGLQADISQLRSRGLRPLALAFSAFLFIGCFSLMLVKFT
ncbi:MULTISPECIES: YeiH family protein [unclassified Mesorhizobium]|uniref:YeiH family protein n=2 Tax=Mesorhizobium TaxID=68287 RepID=UPI000FCAA2C1|nr:MULTISPECIES: YeiH family protein [unclassified Mesorhizobium]RUT85783.1 YeiH family putative sulfate export transporter [Mesorhizobium sp. M7A.T.Ca.US.000.02.2.1]RUT86569.1 YeiH family putative sulfate export transporter [Mesorhizobium sp. M7A.T.Ca.US.000.02.1.1]RUU87691.1 YeiH family putative sulfate export transporter [Mesorhizobium sp. M7A.T.Ca.TU.009.01.1.2]